MKKDYIIRGRRVTVHGHEQDHIIGEIISTGKDVVKGIKSVLPKLSKKKFYAYRDKMYQTVQQIYGKDAHAKVPGNPFSAFSHGTIKDSPIKNYEKEKNGLDAMLLKYFPKVFGDVTPVQTAQQISSDITNTAIQKSANESQKSAPAQLETSNAKVLKPFKPIMKAGVSNAGFVPPENIDALAILFYDKVVKPGTQSTYDHCDYLDEVIVDSILHFIATLQAKREAGEPMNKTYTVIADKATQLQEKGTSIAKDKASEKVGGFVVDNALLIGGIIAIMLVFLIAKK